MYWRLPGIQLFLERPCYIAVLNLTPDSFSDGGLFIDPANAINHATQLLADGAAVIDMGAESTRPASRSVDPQEEWHRMEPVLSLMKKTTPGCIVSIDTRHPEVARRALDNGAKIINDVTGFQNPEMLELVSNSECGLIAVRTRMISDHFMMPDYLDPSPKNADNAILELSIIKDRLLGAGIKHERIVLDPGFGFGTTFHEDRALWDTLPNMPEALNWPIELFCIGISRKRFIAHLFGISGNAMLDKKTIEMEKIAADIGYKIFRTHSVLR